MNPEELPPPLEVSSIIKAVVEGPEQEQEEGIIEQELIKVKLPTTGGKYADKVYPLTNEAYELLRQSLIKYGYLPQYPIIINRQGDILDGHHRLKACIELGIKQHQPTFQLKESKNEIEEELFAIDTNLARRQLTKFQRAELALRKQPLLAEQARRNMEAGKTLSRQQERVHVDEKLAKDSETSKDTIYKVRKITNSELFKENEEFREKVRTEKIRVEHAYTQVMRAEDRDKPKPKPPEGQYDVLYVDPPWDYVIPGRGTPENHYPVMSDDEIKALHIPAAENSVLFLWTTYPKLDVAIDVIRAWGFTYKSNLVWVKDKFGTGFYFRGQHELLLLGVIGEGLGVPAEGDRHSSVLFAPREEHSRKPTEVYEIIEKMYPGRSYIEMFARGEPRVGWTAWGLEANTT
jgi:N6-adenosine-specific RNA methylase IME4/ParB-like chromosome segregation protein Spo0J